MAKKKTRRMTLTQLAYKIPQWAGSPASLLVHTLLFVGAYGMILLGFDAEKVMIQLTSVLSIEAIYLALFIQMTVNKHNKRFKDIEEDIDDILEDTESLTTN